MDRFEKIRWSESLLGGSGISFLGLGCVVLLLNVVRVERWEQNGEQIDKGEDKFGAS